MDNTAYHIYLAVPGRSFCWGTVTGVINSSAKHTVHPFNAGVGFSGAEDFNLCWIDAINCFERGEITHFAMLHGDITPDPHQRWLDILMEEMDKYEAVVVSGHVSLKDGSGTSSCGVGDIEDPWGAFRRFTQAEILNELPETFNNVTAGYPDRPLLFNTGCWVADLRNPIWHETNEDGSLKTIFKFPERAVRGTDGAWTHKRESEDWCLSRELWERGCRDTWITSRVKLTHHGASDFRNWVDYGTFRDGDEGTAPRWRAERESLPLSLVQLLNFELGSGCNLGPVHPECPNLHPERYGSLDTSQELDDDTIVHCAVQAYRELGFSGMVGWHYYNEPLLRAGRMFALMERIRSEVPKARFLLWTNGMLIPEECEQYKQFEQIIVSGYNDQGRRGVERLTAKKINARWIDKPELDNRLVQVEPIVKPGEMLTLPAGWSIQVDESPCLRPFVEFIVDAYGNTHLCCYDWQGKGTLGNVIVGDFAAIAKRWRDQLPHIAGKKMSLCAPGVCQSCTHRWAKYQQHDERIVERARRFRDSTPIDVVDVIWDENGHMIGAVPKAVTT